MTIEHNLLGNNTTKSHGILWTTVADAIALAALVIVAADVAQAKVVKQTDTDQYLIPTTIGAGASYDLVVTGRGTTTGQALTWNNTTKQWVTGTDFGGNTIVTTDGYVANASTGYIRLGAALGQPGSGAATGSIRMARGGGNNATIYGRRNDDAGDVLILQWDSTANVASGQLIIGDHSTLTIGQIVLKNGSDAVQFFGVGGTQILTMGAGIITPIAANIIWTNLGTPSPFIGQVNGGNVCQKMIIRAQGTANAVAVGGAIDIGPGFGGAGGSGGLGRLMSGGAAGVAGGTAQFQWSDLGIGFFATAPVAQPVLADNTTGVPANQLVDVGIAFSQANINNNFASVRAKIAALGLVG